MTVRIWYDEGREVTIPLDLRFTPSQNAQNFFKNYKKKQTAARMLVDLLAEGEKEIAYLETVLYEVESASGEAALNEIRAELKSQGYLKYYKQRDKRQKPADFLRFTSTDGFEILVGRNNVQNDKLTLHTARGKDLWFHVQKAPGSHVVVMSRGEEIPDTTRQEAAELAVLYSSTFKAGTGAKVAVDTTEVKNIWKASGAKPGMVLYEVYTTVYITPREDLAERLRQLFSRTARQMILRLREEYPRSDILTVGGCHLCEHCTRPEGRPCRYPEGIGYTLESLGCDVSAAAEQLLGWPLLWSRKGCLPEYMALVCGVLIR